MKFAIRDDDVNYFTNVDELQEAYHDIWDDVPISFAVIPFVGWRYLLVQKYEHMLTTKKMIKHFFKRIESNNLDCIDEVFFKQHYNRCYLIGENKKLVAYLRNMINTKNASIMLHGYAHDFYSSGYEFEYGTGLEKKVDEAMSYLALLFGKKPLTFVPPNNSFSSMGASAVIMHGLHIVNDYGFYLWERPLNKETIFNFIKLFGFFCRYGKSWRYPYIFRFSQHNECMSYPLSHSMTFPLLRERFDFAYQKGGDFCIYTHYYSICRDNKTKQLLRDIIEYSRNRAGANIEYVSVDNLLMSSS